MPVRTYIERIQLLLTVALALHRQWPSPYPSGGPQNRGHTAPDEPQLNPVQAQVVPNRGFHIGGPVSRGMGARQAGP